MKRKKRKINWFLPQYNWVTGNYKEQMHSPRATVSPRNGASQVRGSEEKEKLIYLRDLPGGGVELCVSESGNFVAHKLSRGMLANIAEKSVQALARWED